MRRGLSNSTVIFVALVILLPAAAVLGWSGYKKWDQIRTLNSDLTAIGQVYISCTQRTMEPPRHWGQLVEHAKTHFPDFRERVLYHAFMEELTVSWNTALSTDAHENAKLILVYEKNAPISGGKVCMGDGTVQHLTATACEDALRQTKLKTKSQ